MNDFAKVFTLNNGCQLLMTKEMDGKMSDEKAQLVFRIRTEHEGVINTMVLDGYRTVLVRDHVYDNFTQSMAQDLYDMVAKKLRR